ncbi:prepilin-type N-terminal cleavage/methylation domain-containing protein [Candidatus Peregrinibacteria bacterium]|nr:prepilin-type N-terminal cleavage/methylation domain-containing protein [Candidatus Peregrinibacteria bacterium]
MKKYLFKNRFGKEFSPSKGCLGFTLVEVLVAMSIFVIFVGVLISSYTSIVKSQYDTNDYRVMYSEARKVFETVVGEFRKGMVDYGNESYSCSGIAFSQGVENIYLIDKDAVSRTRLYKDGDFVKIAEKSSENQSFPEGVALNSSRIKVMDFKVYVYPSVDPYDQRYAGSDSYQFHPLITVFATFEKNRNTGENFKVSFQTSVSSRIYDQVYQITKCK